jgi:hypothetical protein
MIHTRHVSNGAPLQSRALVDDRYLRAWNNRATWVGDGPENSGKLGLGAKNAGKRSKKYNG